MCSKIRKNIRAKGEKRLKKLVLIDGNSIMNRAFYGIMGSKMLTTKDGKIVKDGKNECSVWFFSNII